LAEALGLQVVRLHPGGADRLNPLDAGPLGAADLAELEMRRTGTVTALLTAVLRRNPTPQEESGIGSALAVLTDGPHNEPTLVDVADLLANPTAEMAAEAGCSADKLVEECPQAKLALGRLLSRDLRGHVRRPVDRADRLERPGPGPGSVGRASRPRRAGHGDDPRHIVAVVVHGRPPGGLAPQIAGD